MRADISRLPFVSSSVDAVHAGAAIHCWPSPSAGVSIFFPSFTFETQVLPSSLPFLGYGKSKKKKG